MSELSDNLSKQEKELRDKFVKQYLEDYDPVAAVIRLGYQEAFAKNYASKFLTETYTLQRIAEAEAELGICKDEDRHRRRVVTGLYRITTSRFASASAQVAAYSQLAKIIGLEAPVKSEVKVTENKPDMTHLTLEEKLAIKKKLFPDAP